MRFVSQELVDTSSKCIEVSMTNIEVKPRHQSGTVHKMPFVLSVIPNKMRPRGTQFYGGSVLVVRTTGVGVVTKERAKGRYAKYIDGPGWIKHAARHIICVILFLLSVRTKRQIPTSWVLVLTPSAVS